MEIGHIKNTGEEMFSESILHTDAPVLHLVEGENQYAPLTNRMALWLFSCSTSTGASLYSQNWLSLYFEHLDLCLNASFCEEVEQVAPAQEFQWLAFCELK